MAILVGATPVGFYRLDFRPTIVARRSIGETSVGLRAFFLDVDWQGRGLGTRAVQACCEDVHARHPDRRLLALNVNCRNVAAVNAYRKAGLVDTGELYLGGSAGPKHPMVRRPLRQPFPPPPPSRARPRAVNRKGSGGGQSLSGRVESDGRRAI